MLSDRLTFLNQLSRIVRDPCRSPPAIWQHLDMLAEYWSGTCLNKSHPFLVHVTKRHCGHCPPRVADRSAVVAAQTAVPLCGQMMAFARYRANSGDRCRRPWAG